MFLRKASRASAESLTRQYNANLIAHIDLDMEVKVAVKNVAMKLESDFFCLE